MGPSLHYSEFLLPLVATASAATVAALALLQTDSVSRRTLKPLPLLTKRRREFLYHWKTAIEKTHLLLEYTLAGGQENYNNDNEINLKKFDYLSTEAQQKELAQRILKDKAGQYTTLKIDKDPSDPKEEYYLFIQRLSTEDQPQYFQAPLVPFCQVLRQAFEDQVTTTTLCFVADASAGKASGLLEQLVKEAKTGVAVVHEPFWMVDVARMVQARLFSREKLQTMVFALSRLEAWAVRDQAKLSKTVMITLPGQSTVPSLLPLVQAAFPEDRHVFAYDGCGATVSRAMDLKGKYQRGDMSSDLSAMLYGMAGNPVCHTTPLPSYSPLTKALRGLPFALAALSIAQAEITEAWMASVNAFFQLKDDETKNGYLPYVFNVGYLTKPKGNFAPKSDSYWSLSSVLQFITGTRSKPVAEGVMDSGIEFLKDYIAAQQHGVPLVEADRKAMENCVFQHKSILIGNKTLKDTVQPTQHWTLKQATRAGCSCCGPDPYDEQEEEEAKAAENEGAREKGAGALDMSAPGAFAMAFKAPTSSASGEVEATPAPAAAPKSSGYVDGKMSFAFDPSKFS
eukprot:Nitzschia sp. Nitz4//scaffold24_size164493//130329//132032//NITZ4_002347-RA/size164493-processed-gene-0.211-mRNA-1//1//CDS//3329544171//8303//frame0